MVTFINVTIVSPLKDTCLSHLFDDGDIYKTGDIFGDTYPH